MRAGLTPRMAQLLDILRRSIEANGCAPSYAEMAEAMGLSSRGAVAGMVDRLEDRGFVRRLAGQARTITIVEQSGLSPETERRISVYCRNRDITRQEFDKRAAEGLLRGWA